MKRVRTAGFVVLAMLLCSVAGHAQDTNIVTGPSWAARGPFARAGHTAVLDTAKNKMIVFGGSTFSTDAPPSTHFNDVWFLGSANSTNANESWTVAKTLGTPPNARSLHSAVLDQVNNRMIMFGGSEGFAAPCDNDVWVLSNANGVGGTPTWTQLSPSGTLPTVRFAQVAVYDKTNNVLIVFGGSGCFSGAFNDVWTLSHANGLGGTPVWTQLSPSGTLPAARDLLGAVYDQANNRMIIFGGFDGVMFYNDVWVLTGANGLAGTPSWQQLSTSGGPPAAREAPTATYDSATNRMTIFGGYSTAPDNDVWVLTNANGTGGTPTWNLIAPTGVAPLGRYSHSAVYDPGTKRMIIFGGSTTGAGSATDNVAVFSHGNGL
jgi:hypothetical protein